MQKGVESEDDPIQASQAISLKRIADDFSFVKKVIQIVAAETAPTDDETITRIVRLIKAL